MIDYVLLEKYAKDLSILVVEDDVNTANEIKELLNEISNRVYVAYDGKEAFETYLNYKAEKSTYFDLIITDIQMPNLNGVEFLKLVKNENSTQKIIVLSAHSESNYLLDLINLGINQFILKPLNFEEFFDVIFKIVKMINEEKFEQNSYSNVFKLSSTIFWDNSKKILLKNDKEVKLTKNEHKFLNILLKTPDKTCTNEEIIKKIWPEDHGENIDLSNLKNMISRFRKKMPEINIENIYSFGYRILTIN